MMDPQVIRAITQGLLALAAVGGGLAYALVAQSQGHSPEPPAWLAVLIGGAVTYFYASTAHINGQTAALTILARTMAARRAADVVGPVIDGTTTTPAGGD